MNGTTNVRPEGPPLSYAAYPENHDRGADARMFEELLRSPAGGRDRSDPVGRPATVPSAQMPNGRLFAELVEKQRDATVQKQSPSLGGKHESEPPPPIDVTKLPQGPLEVGSELYERIGERNRYLAGKYDPKSWYDQACDLATGAMGNPVNVLTDAERTEHEVLIAIIVKSVNEPVSAVDPKVAAMEDNPLGTTFAVIARGLGAGENTQTALFGIGAFGDVWGWRGITAKGPAGQSMSAMRRPRSGPPGGDSIPKAWSQEVRSLRDPFIDALVQSADEEIKKIAKQRNTDPRSVEIQVRLHIPSLPEEIRDAPPDPEIVRPILSRIEPRLPDFAQITSRFRRESGIDDLPPESYVVGGAQTYVTSKATTQRIPVRFGEVDPVIGFDIQKHFHYIHGPREDTMGHFGLFLPGYIRPYCYAALSVCDREYQRAALRTVLPNIENEKILIMTRSYGFSPLPQNNMGKLFKFISDHYSATKEYDAIITAVNPLLGFTASTFLGSGYIPFATSPIQYYYNENGIYLSRRQAGATSIRQKMATPPILWLARGLTGEIQRTLDGIQTLHNVSKQQYGDR